MSEKVNPKDVIATGKVSMSLCPDTIRIAGAMAFQEGAVKYGAHNWRGAGVSAAVYKDALDRHIVAWWNGEDIDAKSGLPHIWKALACLAIIADAQMVGKLHDDRPPAAPLGKLLEALEPLVGAIKAQHADKSPRHWTIADSDPATTEIPEDLFRNKLDDLKKEGSTP